MPTPLDEVPHVEDVRLLIVVHADVGVPFSREPSTPVGMKMGVSWRGPPGETSTLVSWRLPFRSGLGT